MNEYDFSCVEVRKYLSKQTQMTFMSRYNQTQIFASFLRQNFELDVPNLYDKNKNKLLYHFHLLFRTTSLNPFKSANLLVVPGRSVKFLYFIPYALSSTWSATLTYTIEL